MLLSLSQKAYIIECQILIADELKERSIKVLPCHMLF
ncbi:MAG: hypothetical protein QG618_421, partial [Thermodesulfobacteriota bacterium]|nr:hypothetical protein [Thermodesulfobacteriota bacterium]